MNAITIDTTPGQETRQVPAAMPGESVLLADWDDVVFLHYAVEPRLLQPLVPFELDRFAGKAWVSLVAFTQRNLRPRRGGLAARWMSTPLARHEFLNLRTNVRHGDE